MKIEFLKVAYNNITNLLLSHNKIFVAYSGGVDSHALLHFVQSIVKDNKKVELIAIHVNHNLSSNAKKWVKHCRQVCQELGVKYITKSIAANRRLNDYSPEEILRKLRYEIFAKILQQDGCLLTAHNANDQAETLLLQLFRGAGPKGLAAMGGKTQFAKGSLARPLLDITREEILHYAHYYKLKWIEDESNVNVKYDRNFIRHQLLPLIKKRWPTIIATINRVSRHCFEASELLDLLAKKDLEELVKSSQPHILHIPLLKKLPIIRQKNVLRFWLHQLSLPLPSEVKLKEIIRTVINSKYDAMPVVQWLGAEVRRFRHDLYAMSPLKPPIINKTQIARKFNLDPKKIKICFRQGGEKIKLAKRQGTHDLKKLMQEWDIPPWLRDHVPLIYQGKNIIAVIGYYPKFGS